MGMTSDKPKSRPGIGTHGGGVPTASSPPSVTPQALPEPLPTPHKQQTLNGGEAEVVKVVISDNVPAGRYRRPLAGGWTLRASVW